MSKNFVYEKTVTTKIKATGLLNLANGTIEVDGEEKKMSSLFSDFDDCEVVITMQISDKEEFDMPEDILEDTMPVYE